MSRFDPGQLAVPVVLAPLAGGPATPALTIAVSTAGGLGFVAAGYQAAASLRTNIEAVLEGTAAPFGVNLFVPGSASVDTARLGAYVERMGAVGQGYGVAPGEPRWDDDGWVEKVEMLVARPVAVVSFTFGCPPPSTIAALQAAGSAVWVTVTEVAEAEQARDAGADALVVQGVEAGGHRASFVDQDGVGQLGLLPLLRLIAAHVDLPLIAAGGIADGPGIAAVLAAGAGAAQLGSAFLRTPEAGTSAAHREGLAGSARTALTRAFTGRLARGLVNQFMQDHEEEAPAAYPQVHHLTAPIRAAARQRGDQQMINMWAGEAFELAQEMPAQELVARLNRDCRAALERAARHLQPRSS